MFSLKTLVKLQQKKYRREYGCFIIEGKKGVLDALASKQEVLQLIMTRKFAREEEGFGDGKELLLVDDHDFAKLTDTVTPAGVAAVVRMPAYKLDEITNGQLIAVLEDIRDPGNLGTMIRTADWFGVSGLLLLGGADPYQAKVVRASMGSLFHLPIIVSQDAINDLQKLQKQGFSLVVTRPELAQAERVQTQLKGKIALIFGNEARGTSREVDQLANQSISIPRYGQAESLNVAVSFGILLAQLRN